MKNRLAILLAFIAAWIWHSQLGTASVSPKTPPPPVQAPIPSGAGFYDVLPDMVERVSPGVVNISSVTVINYQVFGMDEFLRLYGIPQERKQTSLGSGFILDEDGFIITNNHVVDHATEVMVTLADQRRFKAKIIGKDPKMDLALIQIRDEQRKVPLKLKPVPLGDSDKVRIAESVVAVGNPFGLQNTVTKGIISAKNRSIGLGPFDNFIQTDASINPGNSGGPLFNIKGEVIGINSAIRSETGQSSGLGFAIPINEAKSLLPDLKRYGRVPRPWLGIVAERLPPHMGEYFKIPETKGVLVYNRVHRAPADTAGIRKGDIIVSLDGTATGDPTEIERILGKHKPTDQVSIEVYRLGELESGVKKIHKLSVRLEELPRLDELPPGII